MNVLQRLLHRLRLWSNGSVTQEMPQLPSKMLEALPSWLVSASEATKGKVCVCMSMFACLCFVQGLNPLINFAPANMHTDTCTNRHSHPHARVCVHNWLQTVYIILDALNQLQDVDRAQSLHWLPQVRCFLSRCF